MLFAPFNLNHRCWSSSPAFRGAPRSSRQFTSRDAALKFFFWHILSHQSPLQTQSAALRGEGAKFRDPGCRRGANEKLRSNVTRLLPVPFVVLQHIMHRTGSFGEDTATDQ